MCIGCDAFPVIGNFEHEKIIFGLHLNMTDGRLRMMNDIGECFKHNAIRGDFHGGR